MKKIKIIIATLCVAAIGVGIFYACQKEKENVNNNIDCYQKTNFNFDSIFNITVKKIYEQFIADNSFFTSNKEVIFRIIESSKNKRSNYKCIEFRCANRFRRFKTFNRQ